MLVSMRVDMAGKSNIDLLASVLADLSAEIGIEKDAKIIYDRGSKNGDGYSSQNSLVTLTDRNKSISLFIKHTRKNLKESMSFIYDLFETECNAYQVILPALMKFQEDRNIKEPFNNVAKCYKIEKNEFLYAIVLENLRAKGFRLYDRQEYMDEDHVLLAFKTYARLHAISFAMADQNAKLFADLRQNHRDCLPTVLCAGGINAGLVNGLRHYASKNIGDFGKKCKIISEKAIDLLMNLRTKSNEKYEVLAHGDFWCNNVLFSYEDGKKPTDMRSVDFQVCRFSSPVYDLSYFFYVAANQEMLDKIHFYQDYYYTELSKRIRELGSDPELLFPKQIFMEHWIKYGLFGFSVGIYMIKIMLYQESEVPTGEDVYMNTPNLVTANIQHEDQYLKRIDALFKHFIDYLKI